MADGMHEMSDMMKNYALRALCSSKGLDARALTETQREELISEWKAMCEKKRNEDRASEDNPNKAETIDDPAALLAVPTLYKDAEITDFKDTDWMRALRSGSSGVIVGGNGVGKTHMSWALAKDWKRTNPRCSVAIVNAINLLGCIKSISGDWYTEIEDRFGMADHLVIDEIDKVFATDADRLLLFDLINFRYSWARQTIVMGNCDKDRLIDIVGQSSYSRLSGTGCVSRNLIGGDKRRGMEEKA